MSTTMNGSFPTPTQPQANTPDPSSLPADTLAFAARMFEAARTGDPDGALIAAIDAGLPANLTNYQGNTLLMLCTYSSPSTHTLALTRALLSKGADPNRLNDAGQSMLAGVIFKRSSSKEEIAVRDKVVRLLLEKGADPRMGKPNAIECVWMFIKEDRPGDAKDSEAQGDGGKGLGRDELLKMFGATEGDKERMEREGVRIGPPGIPGFGS